MTADGPAGRPSAQRHRLARQHAGFRFAGLAVTLVAAGLVLSGVPADAAESVAASELARPGRLLMLRHANAPGLGDPPNFTLGDCSTQRNLDAAGRAQASELGARLARAGVTGAVVYSSQWCRCLETAQLLKLGPPRELPSLNSFYGRAQQRDPSLRALREFLAGLPVGGPPVILVTHQVTITAFTGRGTASGGGTVFELDGSGTPRVLGELRAD
jgi:phosphohistidine phosphatase SixA